ncbi:hypothetical protein GBA52_028494 [Prunus armeniaca]|nr:hypothetical protein GBA52_028494 [Prunus armeniaca]
MRVQENSSHPLFCGKHWMILAMLKASVALTATAHFMTINQTVFCLPGTDYADSDQRTLGCLRNYTEVKCNDGKENTSSYHMITMENMVLEDMAYYEAGMLTVKECSRSCLEDCNCGAAVFNSRANVCVKQNLPLRYVRRDPKEYSTAVFKIGNSPNNTNPAIPLNPITTVVTDKKLSSYSPVRPLQFLDFIFSKSDFCGTKG